MAVSHCPRTISVLGISLIVISTFLLAIQNVIVKVMFAENRVLGLGRVGGYVEPSIGDSLLLLLLRTLLMALTLAAIAPLLHRDTYRDLGALFVAARTGDRHIERLPGVAPRTLSGLAIASAALLYLALALLFVAIGKLTTGIAVTIFFIYPAITALLAWLVFGERPSGVRWAIVGLMAVGVSLASPQGLDGMTAEAMVGAGAAVLAGVTYAVHGILSQQCLRVIHPVPFTLLTFWVMLAVGGATMPLFAVQVGDGAWSYIWLGSCMTATVTLAAYTLNNFGIRAIGVTPAFLVGSLTPIFTVLVAWVAIAEALQGRQVFGVLFVVAGALGLAFEQYYRSKAGQQVRAPETEP